MPATGGHVIFILLRICLFCYGLLLFTTGVAEFVAPEMLHSADLTRKPRHHELVMGVGFLGYGGLLLVGPRLLYRRHLLCSVLFILTLILAVSAWLAVDVSVARVVRLLVFFSPVALVLLLVAREARLANAALGDGEPVSRS